jgi:glucose-1-phosphate adenylyltransferase
VGTLDSFWEANMELVHANPALNMYDPDWPIWTYQEQLPPAKFVHDFDGRRGSAIDSVVSGGCIISGSTVRRSVLFSNVHLHSHSYVEGSVILPGVDIGRGVKLKNVIVDRGVRVPDGLEVGFDMERDKAEGFRISPKGRVLITRGMLGQPEGYA